MGLTTVSLLYLALRQGVDIAPLLAWLGVEKEGAVLGQWAAAVVCSAPLWPVCLASVGTMAPLVSKAASRLVPP